MSAVSLEFLARWRQEVEALVGGSARRLQRPVAKVYVRTGRVRRSNKPWTGPEINAFVVGGDNDEPWQGTYVPFSDWVEIPNVITCDVQGSLEDKASHATVVVENVELAELSPMGDLYHAIERGWLSPWRGSETEFTPPAVDEQNDWYRLLDQRLQIKVWQGYGDELVPTFLGFLDDDDIVAMPDRITTTARCASAIIADQRFYGWSKEVSHPDPVTFADRLNADDTERVGSDAAASSSQTDHEAAKVLDGDPDTQWWSDDHTADNVTEWVEIEIPEGRYDSFRINTRGYKNMLAYIAIDSVDGQVDGVPVPDGWVDNGSGTVPGGNGGFEYVKTFTTVDGVKIVWLPFEFRTDGGSKLRIAFRDLKKKGDTTYRAGVVALKAIARDLAAEAHTEGWILVDDVADIVRLILRWCGFKEWYVEDANMRLRTKWVVNRESFLMDMIDDICERTGFVFFINDPSTDDDSLGFPVFRANQAIFDKDADDDVPVIEDSDLLSRAQVRFTEEPLTYNIRVRGRLATKDEGGIVVSRDARRLLAHYKPPWTTETTPSGIRTGGIIKRTFLDRFWIKKQTLLDYAARMVALYQALASATALIEIPANPGIELDQHVLLYDKSTGLNTRMWTNARNSSFVAGDEPKWTMSLNGGLIDTPHMDAVRADIRALDEDADS